MKTINIEINCGEQTCASAPGSFCKFMGTRRFGTEFVCRLFPTSDDSYTLLSEDASGWLQRCESCLSYQK